MLEIEEKEIRDLDGPLESGRYAHCLFEGCIFDERDFSGSTFLDCRFQDCLLNQVDLTHVRFKDVEFAESKLMGLYFPRCNPLMFSPFFTNTKLFRCAFSGMKIKGGVNFDECMIEECDFTESIIKNSKFTKSKLKGTNFHLADLSGSDFQDAIDFHIDPIQTKITKCKFSAPEVLSLLDVFELEIS